MFSSDVYNSVDEFFKLIKRFHERYNAELSDYSSSIDEYENPQKAIELLKQKIEFWEKSDDILSECRNILDDILSKMNEFTQTDKERVNKKIKEFSEKLENMRNTLLGVRTRIREIISEHNSKLFSSSNDADIIIILRIIDYLVEVL